MTYKFWALRPAGSIRVRDLGRLPRAEPLAVVPCLDPLLSTARRTLVAGRTGTPDNRCNCDGVLGQDHWP